MTTITVVPSITRAMKPAMTTIRLRRNMGTTTRVRRSMGTTTRRTGPNRDTTYVLLSTTKRTGRMFINRITGRRTNTLATTGTKPRIRQPTMSGRVSVQGIGSVNTAHGTTAVVT